MTTPENSSAINCTKNQKPKLSLFQDGGQWCVLYGDDLQSGPSSFAPTPEEALTVFAAYWLQFLAPQGVADGLTFAEMKANSDRYLFLRDGDWRDSPLEPFIRLQLNLMWDSKIDAMLRGESLGTPPFGAEDDFKGRYDAAKPQVPKVYTQQYLHDLTCMHAGAPWDTPVLTALGEILAIHDMLRDNGEYPVDPATLPWKPVIDGEAPNTAFPDAPAEARKDPVPVGKDAGFDSADIAAAMGFLTGMECYGSSNAVGNLLTAYEELQRKMLALKDLINT